MRILLTNNTLDYRAGTELYLRDVALGLLRRGHAVFAFSLQHGRVAKELQAAGVEVMDDLRTMEEVPDVIHGQHAVETTLSAMFFPGTPVISFCHGPEAWQEAPCRLPNVAAWVAVDTACQRRLVEDEHVPSDKVRLLLNFVDLDLYQKVRVTSQQPQQALLFSNYLSKDHPVTQVLETVCGSRGIHLDFCGAQFDSRTSNPEQLLPQYDVVFAKGRSALESLACGCAVIPVEYFGAGELITTGNYEEIRLMNFGYQSMTYDVTADHISEQLKRFDAKDVSMVTAKTRAEASLKSTLDQLESLYMAATSHKIPDFDPIREASDFLRFQFYLSKIPMNSLHKTLRAPLRLPVPPHTASLPELWESIRAAHTPLSAVAYAELQARSNAREADHEADRNKWAAKNQSKSEKIEMLKAEIHQLKSRPHGFKKLSRKFMNIFPGRAQANE